MTAYSNIDLDQHWLGFSLVAWRHKAEAMLTYHQYKIQWHSSAVNITRVTPIINHYNQLENNLSKIFIQISQGPVSK